MYPRFVNFCTKVYQNGAQRKFGNFMGKRFSLIGQKSNKKINKITKKYFSKVNKSSKLFGINRQMDWVRPIFITGPGLEKPFMFSVDAILEMDTNVHLPLNYNINFRNKGKKGWLGTILYTDGKCY